MTRGRRVIELLRLKERVEDEGDSNSSVCDDDTTMFTHAAYFLRKKLLGMLSARQRPQPGATAAGHDDGQHLDGLC